MYALHEQLESREMKVWREMLRRSRQQPYKYHYSPKAEARRKEKADIATGRVKIHTFECRFCHKKFKTTNPYVRYCCDTHRSAHLSQDNIEDTKGKFTRHHSNNAGDGDGSQR